MPKLIVEARVPGKAKKARAKGSVPAVVYGAHHASTPITVEARAFDKVLREAGESSIVTLTGLPEGELPTLIHEVDLDPVTHRPRHVDFYAVTKGEKVEVAIPLEFIGESPAVLAGNNLIKVMHELPVKADPMNLPHSITVDLSKLVTVGDQIHVRELPVPSDVEVLSPEEEVVALIQEVRAEPEPEAAPADLSQIKVEGEEKEKTEEAEAPAEGK